MITEFLRAKMVHRKFIYSAMGIDCNPIGTPLEIDLVSDGWREKSHDFLWKGQKVIHRSQRSPLRQIRATA